MPWGTRWSRFIGAGLAAGALAMFAAACDGIDKLVTPATATATPTATPSPTAEPTTTPSPTPSPTPEPTPPPLAPGLAALQESLQATVDGYWVHGNYAFAVTDLQTGQTVGVNLDQRQLSGCIMNLYVLIVALQDVDAGAYPLATVDQLIRDTVWSSNAQTAYRLFQIAGNGDATVGVQKVAALHRNLGYELSSIDHPPAFGDDTLGPRPDNWVTTREVNVALAALYNGELLSPELTAYLLDAMVEVKPGLNYLTAWGNGGVTSHKNGFFQYGSLFVDNDSGIVRFERDGVEHAYAVSFFSDDVGTKYGDIVLGQQLMSRVWEYFDGAY